MHLEHNLLIVGQGEDSTEANTIKRVESKDQVYEEYGSSALAEACKVAFDHGLDYVYVANTPFRKNIIDVANKLPGYNFEYIVPVSINISNTFLNKRKERESNFYVEYILNKINNRTSSTIVATDNHASLYKDIDLYLDYIEGVKDAIKNSLSKNSHLEANRLYFVSNNLEKHRYANVSLAASLCKSEIQEYPSGNFGSTIFDIDHWDIEKDIIYFKDNFLTDTTIENLYNLSPKGEPRKDIIVDRIARYIEENLDLDNLKGKPATNYQKAKAEQKVIDFLEGERYITISDYRINNIYFDREGPAYKDIKVNFDIVPIAHKKEVNIKVGG